MSETDPRRDALRCIECEFRTDDSPDSWYELSDHRRQTGHRYEHVRPARKPLTGPDPQVVAWMRGHLRIEQRWSPLLGGPSKAGATRAWLDAHGYATLADSPHTLREMVDAYEAARAPTMADIPAGQGAASLFIGHGRYGELAVMYRTGLTHDHVFMTKGPDDPSEARRAMWDHLAATLPTVTTEED